MTKGKMLTLLAAALLTTIVGTANAQLSPPVSPCTDQGSWTTLNANYQFGTTGIIAPFLLTDGSVMAQEPNQLFWFRLVPSNIGSYTDPTLLWTETARLPSGYAPGLFAGAVLDDGKLIIEGGEYNFGVHHWTNLGAIFDPVANSWTPITGPWSNIGDAPSVVLPNKTFMLGHVYPARPTDSALLNESLLTWSPTGSGKADSNSEEGWTLLPNGKVLTVDVNQAAPAKNYELYDPTSGTWSSGSTGTVVQLYGDSEDGDTEIGPAILRPDGSVFAMGAYVPADGVAHTAIYSTATNSWTAGPSMPSAGGVPLGMGDAPAALLRNGNVLMAATPHNSTTSTYLLEFDGTNLCQLITNVPTSLSQTWNSEDEMLMLPTGQVMIVSDDTTGDPAQYFYVFTPSDPTIYSGAPTLNNLTVSTIHLGSTNNLVTGTRFNGISQESAYGDDFQNATNYPLVRITNISRSTVVYARTHGHSTMAVATGSSPTYTYFDMPASADTGLSSLVVIANGVPSNATAVNIQP